MMRTLVTSSLSQATGNQSSSPEECDLLVLGSGEAGKYLAWTLVKTGRKCMVIERKYVGGSCPNIACLPSKNIIYSAKVASYFWRSHEFGTTKDNCRIHMELVRERKRRMVEGLVNMHLDNFKASGAQLILGGGRFIGPKTVEVALVDGGTRTFRGENVVISTGSRATIDRVPGLVESNPLSHRVTTGRQVPFCMFTDPEFARIGLSEREAAE